MLLTVRSLLAEPIEATDGLIGRIDSFLFDDTSWVIRYIVVDCGRWLPGRRVLVSPISVESVDVREHRIRVRLSRTQIRNSPDIDTDRPVSRQMEVGFYDYYGYAPYWAGGSIWGAGAYPGALAAPIAGLANPIAIRDDERQDDPHLRSTRAVTGYHLQATDGDAGHVDDFLVDDGPWTVWRLIVDTSNWPGGRSVLVSPRRVRAVDWAASRLWIDIPRERVLRSPEYRASELLA